MTGRPFRLHLYDWRLCPLPTWRLWMLLMLAAAAVGAIALRTIHPFLSLNAPLPSNGGVLVVDGCYNEQTLALALEEYQRGGYRELLVTGAPIGRGASLLSYTSLADRGVAILTRLKPGISPQPIPDDDAEAPGRSAARSVAAYLKTHNLHAPINVIAFAPSARFLEWEYVRSLGRSTAVGVIPVLSDTYDPLHWWRSSSGVRTVVDETVRYACALLGSD